MRKKRTKLSAYDKSIQLLARRGYAVKELTEALLKKKYPAEEVLEAINLLLEHRYLNDESFAYERIRSRALLSKWGKRRIQTELKNKGVDEAIIHKAFNQFEEGTEERLGETHDWQQEATDLLLRKYGAFPNTLYEKVNNANGWEEKQDALKSIHKEKSKRINFLLRRGFSNEQAIKALEQA